MRLFTNVFFIAILSILGTIPAYTQQITMFTPDQCVQPGDTISVDVLFDGFTEIVAAQFSLEWDETILDYQSVGNFGVPLGGTNFNFSQTSSGNLGFAWFIFPGQTLAIDEPLFTIEFVVTGSQGTNSDIILTNVPTNPIEFSQGFPPAVISFSPAQGAPIGTITVDGPPMAVCQDISISLNPADSTASIIPAQVDGGSTDDCLLDSLSVTPSMFTFADIGTNTVTLTAYDNTGNTATCTAVVNVFPPGGPGPVAVCQDISIQLDANGMASIVPADVDGGSAGNGTLAFSVTQTDFDCSDIGDNTVILTVTDDDGTATCSSTVTVEDVTPPTVTCGPDLTLSLDGNGDASIIVEDIEAGSSDNCSIALFGLSQSSFSCADVGANTVTLTATDVGGNTASCSVQITIEDNQAPSVGCQDLTVSLDASGMVSITPAEVSTGESDNCPPVNLALSESDFDCVDVGNNTVTLTATDANGNTATCTAQITVEDVDAPIALCQDITIQLDTATNTAMIVPADVDAGSSDNCNFFTTVTPDEFDMNDLGDNTVTFIATDGSSNSSTCTSVVTVLAADSGGPEALCQDITVDLDAAGSVTIEAADVDGGTTGEIGLMLSISQNSFSCADIGDNPVELYAEDPLGADTCTAIVTVEDNLAPDPQCEDTILYLDAAGSASLTPEMIDAGSSDNCEISSLSLDQTSFDCSHVGAQTLTLTIEDNSGNTAACTATVTVEDTLSPTVVCQDISVSLNSDGEAILSIGDIDGGSADNCELDSLFISQDTFLCAEVGVNEVTLTAIDVNGNVSECTANVTVQDLLPPTAICQTVSIGVGPNGQVTLPPTSVDGGSMDNCGVDSLAVSPSVFTCADIGTENVTLTVFDVNGNSSTCDGTVIVQDNTDPTAVCQDVTVELTANGTVTVPAAIVDNGSVDNCSAGNLFLSPNVFDCDDVGVQTAVLTVTDGSGNTGTCETQITVEDNLNPTAVCQPATVYLSSVGAGFLNPLLIDGGSTDNCSVISRQALPSQFNCNDLGEQPVELVVTDPSGNRDTCSTIVMVLDTFPPVSFCQNTSVVLDTNGNAVVDPLSVGGGSNDICGGESLQLIPNTFTCDDLGDNPVDMVVSDGSGNTDTCQAIVTVFDDLAPAPQCQDVTLMLNADGQASVTPAEIDNGSTDNCLIDNLSLSQTDFGCDEIGDQTVTLTVQDNSGNTAACTATVTVEDNIAPVAVCQDITVDIGLTGEVTITGAQVDGGSMDNCTIDQLTPQPALFNCDDLGMQMTTLTVTDIAGNTATCTANVFVDSKAALNITCQDATIDLDPDGLAEVDPALIFTGGGDICNSTITFTVTPAAFDCSQQGEHPVTLIAVDEQGDTDSCTVTVTVQDATPPQAICEDVALQIGGSGKVSVTPQQIDGGSTDNCPGLSLVSVEPEVFFCEDIGASSAVLTVQDAVGNISTCEATVQLTDIITPEAVCQNVSVELDENGQVTVNPQFIGDNSMDNCNELNLSLSQANFDCDDIGLNQVVLTATDLSGNTSTCTANITVRDLPDNNIQCMPATIQLNGSGTASITAADVLNELPETFCDQLTINISQTQFDCSDILSFNQISVTISDPLGPVFNCATQVFVQDNLSPNLSCSDITVSVGPNGTVNIIPADVINIVTDNCGGVTTSLSESSFNCSDIGQNAVTVTATDNVGNTSTCQAIVTINAGTSLIALCQDAGVELDANGNATITPADIDAGSTSSCGDPILSLSQSTFDCDDIGDNTVTLTVSNTSGNSTSCTATVSVADNLEPFVICQDFDLELDPDGSGFILPTDVVDMINTEDNCGLFNVVSAIPSVFDCSDIGPNEVAVVVVDNNGNEANCVATVNVFAGPGLGLFATVTTSPESEVGAMDGSAAVNVSNGSGVYEFLWSNGGTNSVINNLSTGTYTVTVTDEVNGCQVVVSGLVGIGSAVTFIAGDVSGETGQTIDIPVTVEEFNNVSSFQLSLHVQNGAVASVNAVTDVNSALPGPTVSVVGNDITFEWMGGGQDGVTLADGELLFNIEVDLTGAGGTSSPVVFDNNPLPIQVTQSFGGNTQAASVVTEDGSVSINAIIEYTISGQFITYQDQPVKNVDVTLSGSTNGFVETGANGNYSFTVSQGSNVTVTPEKDTFYLNGVTTFDLVRITQHILGVDLFDTPYQTIASDATGDEMVTTFDIVTFRQLILQIIPALPNNSSWRFVRADHTFQSITNPWNPPFPELTNYNNVNQNFTGEDYISVKIGDVTGDVNPQAFGDLGGDDRYQGTLEFFVKDKEVEAGAVFELPVYASNFTDLLGFQFAMQFDAARAELLEVIPGTLEDLSKESFALNRADEGRLLTSWFTAYPQTVSPEEPLFTLRFRNGSTALSTGALLSLNPDWMQKEAYSADARRLDIQLKADPTETTAAGFFVNQNRPNPFSANTEVTFWLPEAAEVTFTLLNASGQEVSSTTENREKGFGHWTIDQSGLNGAGVYYYMIATPFGTEVRKMVCLD